MRIGSNFIKEGPSSVPETVTKNSITAIAIGVLIGLASVALYLKGMNTSAIGTGLLGGAVILFGILYQGFMKEKEKPKVEKSLANSPVSAMPTPLPSAGARPRGERVSVISPRGANAAHGSNNQRASAAPARGAITVTITPPKTFPRHQTLECLSKSPDELFPLGDQPDLTIDEKDSEGYTAFQRAALIYIKDPNNPALKAFMLDLKKAGANVYLDLPKGNKNIFEIVWDDGRGEKLYCDMIRVFAIGEQSSGGFEASLKSGGDIDRSDFEVPASLVATYDAGMKDFLNSMDLCNLVLKIHPRFINAYNASGRSSFEFYLEAREYAKLLKVDIVEVLKHVDGEDGGFKLRRYFNLMLNLKCSANEILGFAKLLIDRGIKLDERDFIEKVLTNNYPINVLEYFLKNGADANQSCRYGYDRLPAIFVAAHQVEAPNYQERLRLFKRHGANVNDRVSILHNSLEKLSANSSSATYSNKVVFNFRHFLIRAKEKGVIDDAFIVEMLA